MRVSHRLRWAVTVLLLLSLLLLQCCCKAAAMLLHYEIPPRCALVA